MLKKVPHTYVIIFSIIVLSAIMTAVITPGKYVDDENVEECYSENKKVYKPASELTPAEIEENGGNKDYGVQTWQIFSALFKGFEKQSGIIVFILMIGGAFWIMNSTKAIDVGIFAFLRMTKKLEKFKFFRLLGVHNIIMTMIMLMFSAFGAIFGMSEETIAFTIILVPLAISMGYDSITGVALVFVAAGLGFAGAILNPFTIGIAQGLSDLPLFSGIEYRLVCWLIINVVGIGFILRYAKKIRNNPERSLVYKEDEYWRNMSSNEGDEINYFTPISAWISFILIAGVLIVVSVMYPSTTIKIGEPDLVEAKASFINCDTVVSKNIEGFPKGEMTALDLVVSTNNVDAINDTIFVGKFDVHDSVSLRLNTNQLEKLLRVRKQSTALDNKINVSFLANGDKSDVDICFSDNSVSDTLLMQLYAYPSGLEDKTDEKLYVKMPLPIKVGFEDDVHIRFYSEDKGSGSATTLPVFPVLAGLFVVLGIITLRKSVHFYILWILIFTMLILVAGVMGYEWYIMRIATLFLAMGVAAGIAFNKSPDNIVKLFLEGVKDIMSAAIVVGLAAGIIVILEDGMIIDTILYRLSEGMQGLGKTASVGFMYVIQNIINIIIPSGSAKAAITMPIMAPFSDLIGISRQATVMAFQFGDGFTNMITPTSGILIAVLGIARIPYEKWVKWILPLMIIMIILGFLLLIPTVTMDLNGF
jgi:uncharacterized ion transporter superfamily protein YfcC